jgi:hypothetical protein
MLNKNPAVEYYKFMCKIYKAWISKTYVTESIFDKSETAEENRIARKPEHNWPGRLLAEFDRYIQEILVTGKSQEVS